MPLARGQLGGEGRATRRRPAGRARANVARPAPNSTSATGASIPAATCEAARAELVALQQRDRHPALAGAPGDGETDDPAAHDHDVEALAGGHGADASPRARALRDSRGEAFGGFTPRRQSVVTGSQRARLYLVCAAGPDGVRREELELPDLVRSAVAGGVDVVQLREKQLADDELTAVASAAGSAVPAAGSAADRQRPPVGGGRVRRRRGPRGPGRPARAGGARDRRARRCWWASRPTAPAEIDAVDPDLVDYIGVGPVHETPTKPGRPAVGLELVRYAAANATVPFFAIGGLDAGNLSRGAGTPARGGCACCARSPARPTPEAAARELCGILDEARRRRPTLVPRRGRRRRGRRRIRRGRILSSRDEQAAGRAQRRWPRTSARPRCWSRSSSAGCWPWA